jgi:hypothetical protein
MIAFPVWSPKCTPWAGAKLPVAVISYIAESMCKALDGDEVPMPTLPSLNTQNLSVSDTWEVEVAPEALPPPSTTKRPLRFPISISWAFSEERSNRISVGPPLVESVNNAEGLLVPMPTLPLVLLADFIVKTSVVEEPPL